MSTSSSPPTASPAPAVGSPPAFWDIAYKQKSGDLQAVTRMPTGPMPVDTIRNLQAWYYSHLSKGERIKHKLGMSKPIIEIAQLGASEANAPPAPGQITGPHGMGLYLARQTFPEALLTRELSELQYFKTLSPLFFAGLYSYLAVQHGQPPNFIVIVGQRRRTQGHRTSERHAIPVVMTVVMAASHIAHIVVMSLGGPWATVPDWLQILGNWTGPRGLVSSLYGPGTTIAWLLTVVSVFVTWTLNQYHRRRDTITSDFVAVLAFQSVASIHLTNLVANFPGTGSDLFTSDDPATVRLGLYSLVSIPTTMVFSAGIGAGLFERTQYQRETTPVKRLLYFIPQSSASFKDLDQAMAVGAGALTLSFSIYEAFKKDAKLVGEQGEIIFTLRD